ncbi:MAG: DUF423 domain-containing protein [Parvibaculum sp.]|nr:DUF423 domain-containing protein [Parvibaculum sp.]
MKLWLTLGALSGFLAVAFGAFGAHGLASRATPEELNAFEIGARYHMYHALALLAVAWLATYGNSALVSTAGWAFVVGIVVFSGSLYVLGITGSRALVLATPLGGVAFMIGWACIFARALKFPS